MSPCLGTLDAASPGLSSLQHSYQPPPRGPRRAVGAGFLQTRCRSGAAILPDPALRLSTVHRPAPLFLAVRTHRRRCTGDRVPALHGPGPFASDADGRRQTLLDSFSFSREHWMHYLIRVPTTPDRAEKALDVPRLNRVPTTPDRNVHRDYRRVSRTAPDVPRDAFPVGTYPPGCRHCVGHPDRTDETLSVRTLRGFPSSTF